MKVLLVSRDCQIGGVEAFTAALARALRRRGVECELFFFERGPMEQHLPPEVPAHFGDLAECLKFVRAGGFDVVHGHSSDWQHGVAALRNAGAKLVLTSHGWVVPDWNSANSDGLAGCSEWQTVEQRALTDLPVRTILNGIDTDVFRPAADAPPAGPPIIAWVGRGSALVQKRIDKLAAIAPALRSAGLRLWIADPYGEEEVAKLAPDAARALRPAAEFWGGVPRERMPGFFQEVAASGGCLLSTSSFEGLPLALAEAQACGCPVIASDVRGNNEVVSAEHGGELYPFETDAAQLAALVVAAVGDAGRMRRRREACARFARERFGLERMARDYIQLYGEALGGGRRGGGGRRAGWSPLLKWGEYVDRRWGAGRAQYETSRKLAEQGEWELASAVARLSLVTCPTIYARPGRLWHLLKTQLRPARRL